MTVSGIYGMYKVEVRVTVVHFVKTETGDDKTSLEGELEILTYGYNAKGSCQSVHAHGVIPFRRADFLNILL